MNKIYPFCLIFSLVFLCHAALAQCDFSDNCEDAIEINFVESFNAFEACDASQNAPLGLKGSKTGCNIDAAISSVNSSSCIEDEWKIVWYKFNSGDFTFTDIVLKSSDVGGIRSFGLDVFQACDNASILNFPITPCERVDNSTEFGTITMLELEPNTEYLIAVGSSIINAGSFSLEVLTYDLESTENDNCFSQDIEIIPNVLPPYTSGQTVEFTVKIPALDLSTQVLGLQSLIPNFGLGWDPSSFNSGSGEPEIQSLPNNNWSWFAEEEIFYKRNSPVYRTYTDLEGNLSLCRGNDCPENFSTCLTEGNWFPAGWFVYQDGAGSDCIEESGNPNFGWGDWIGPWEMTFTLKVRELTAEEYISGENNDLSIEIHTFTDVEIGCWDQITDPFNGCINNKPGKFTAYIDCLNKPIIDAGENVSLACNDEGAIELSGSGPSGSEYIILWTSENGEIIGDSTNYNIEVNGEGRYILTVTNSNSACSSVDEVYVSYESVELEINTIDNLCHGDEEGSAELVLEPGGSETILWSTGETSVGISELAAGNYSVTLTDENCISTNEFEILEGEEIEIGLDVVYPSGSGIEDGTVTLEINGGMMPYSILWDNGETGELRGNLGMGTYSVTVTDFNACEQIGQVVMINGECGFGAKLIETSENACNGHNDAAIFIETYGDRELLKYEWSNGARGHTIRKLYAGDYSVTVSNSENCNINLSYRVNEPEAIEIQLSPIPESSSGANDGSILSEVSGGTAPYSYLWSTGATGEDLVNGGAGWYSLQITDANQCVIYQEVEIPEPPTVVSIFPNPTDRFVTVRGVKSEDIDFYTIYNLWGTEVNLTNTIAEDLIIDIEHLQPGIYYLEIGLINGSRHTFRIIKNF